MGVGCCCCGIEAEVDVVVVVSACGVVEVVIVKKDVATVDAGGHHGVVGGVYHGAVWGVHQRKVEVDVLCEGSDGSIALGVVVVVDVIWVAKGVLVVASGVHHGVVGGVYHRNVEEDVTIGTAADVGVVTPAALVVVLCGAEAEIVLAAFVALGKEMKKVAVSIVVKASVRANVSVSQMRSRPWLFALLVSVFAEGGAGRALVRVVSAASDRVVDGRMVGGGVCVDAVGVGRGRRCRGSRRQIF